MPSSNANYDYSTYLSPFTMRYGSAALRHTWSEENKRLLWRRVWVALARAQHKAGLVTSEELADIVSHEKDIDIPKSKEIEKEIYHELMAEIRVFSEQCHIGGGKIHVGATSTDILDNTTSIQVHDSLASIRLQLHTILSLFTEKIKAYKNTPCIGYTHLQPAEPTTMGYRLAFYAQDLLMDLKFLDAIYPLLETKGIKGAVGTSASYEHVLSGKTSAFDLEKDIMKDLGLIPVIVTGQVYPRKIDLLVIELLSNIAASLHKFAFDYRILQQPSIGEWIELRDAKRVGSSAMPFKRNPDKAEKIDSLCRYVSSLFPVAWSNPANSLLERTLDDSASARIFLPEGFLAIDECLSTATALLKNLQIDDHAVARNLEIFGPFAATEPLLMTLVTKGADRQQMHEVIKTLSMQCWESRHTTHPLSLSSLLKENKEIKQYMTPEEIEKISSPEHYTGLAQKRTDMFLASLASLLQI